MPTSPESWPRPAQELDVFPFVESVEFLDIRLDYADPLGSFLNQTLSKHNDPRRYVCIFFEDDIKSEGLHSLEEARELAHNFISGENFFDDEDKIDPEKQIRDILTSLEPTMDENEKRAYNRLLINFEMQKKQFDADLN